MLLRGALVLLQQETKWELQFRMTFAAAPVPDGSLEMLKEELHLL